MNQEAGHVTSAARSNQRPTRNSAVGSLESKIPPSFKNFLPWGGQRPVRSKVGRGDGGPKSFASLPETRAYSPMGLSRGRRPASLTPS